MIEIDVNERVERAKEYFKSGYNCAQAVAMAYNDIMDMSVEQVAKLAAPFGGGMGRMRAADCIVMDILVPVSPSGTGNTLSESIYALFFSSRAAPARNISLRSAPFIVVLFKSFPPVQGNG